MLSRFSDVLQSAADVLAPPPTKIEDFEYHWKIILNFYQNYDENSKGHVEETRIPHHLDQMLQLLVSEEEESNNTQSGTVGPCMEAILSCRVRLLDALSALAAADTPPGARHLALTAATALLRRTQCVCLNSVHQYRPLQRMLVQCSEHPASPTEKEEVELLLTLCGLVRKEPGLANVFTTPYLEDKTSLLKVPDEIRELIPIKQKQQTPKKNPLFEVPPTNSLRNVSIIRVNGKDSGIHEIGSSSGGDDNQSCKSHKTVNEDNDKFLLIDLLLSYLNSADTQVVLRACEGIMIVCSLPDEGIANLVVSCSPVCEILIEKLRDKYKAIPAGVDPCDIDHLNITWGYVNHEFGEKGYNKFHGFRELTSFFSWLDYCDTLMKECHPCIAAHLARMFRAGFLETAADAGLADLSNAVLVTALVSKSLKAVDSPELINEFSNWLVGGDCEEGEWPLLLQLIENCLSDRQELAIETLRFFEALIEKPTESSIQRLVLSRLCSRGYYCAEPVTLAQEDDERERLNDVSVQRERERNREAMKQLEHEGLVSSQVEDILSHEGLETDPATSSPPAPDHIHKVINSLLLLVPRALLSDPVGADYEQYIHDAHRHYQIWLEMTANFKWPCERTANEWQDNTASSTHSYDSRPESDLHLDETTPNTNLHDLYSSDCFTQKLVLRPRDLKPNDSDCEFDEGPFLRMLFKLLSSMPFQPYQLNLHLTSIISKLAMLPHPNLHEYLLNPTLPTASKTRTLFKTLKEVAQKLTLEIPRLKNYRTLIENTRLQLMSEDPAYDVRGIHNPLVESLIVLEEFCKELAAIAFVKYQHSQHFR